MGRYKAAAHCLARLRRKGRIPKLTVIPRDRDGRPAYQYGSWDVGNAGMHEYLVTELAMLFREWEWTRGPHVGKRRPDAEVRAFRFLYVELDTGTESEAQFKERMDNYRGCDDLLLVVVHDPDYPERSPSRVIRLMAWSKSEPVSKVAFFCTLGQLKDSPWDARWSDVDGKTSSLAEMARRSAGER